MPGIEDLQDLKADLIRKATTGSVFIAEHSAPTIDETDLFDGATGDLDALPTGYDDLGYLTTAGAQFSRAISTSDVTSWQSVTPTRSDITADTDTLQVACQETKLSTIGLYLSQDTGDIHAASNGVVRIDKAKTPTARFYRALSVAVDLQDDGEIVIAHYLPRAQPTAFDNQNFAQGDDPILWPVTFTGRVDDALGFSGSYLFGGAGWLARLTAMGLQAAAIVPVITSAAKVTGGGLNLAAAGGQMVAIHGRGFTGVTGAAGVKFGATNATEYDVVNDTLIVATAPAHATGAAVIVVTNPTGPSTTGPTATYV